MGGYQWRSCPQCQAEGRTPDYHPQVALYARPQGKKGMVRVGWLLRCGHVIIDKNIAEKVI